MTTMNDHDSCIILNLLNGIGGLSSWKSRGTGINALIAACGSVSAVFSPDAGSLAHFCGLTQEQAYRISRWREFVDLDHELTLAEKSGATILCRTDDGYPESLRGLRNPPLCLYLRGTLPDDLAFRSIAIVGTRTPSGRGLYLTRAFSASAAIRGWTTVSGLAVGIDSMAHRSTVEACGRTVAVLGSGLARIFPDENSGLASDILRAGGAIVSEYPMETDATRYTLPRRNRIIAGLSRCTLVIEAAQTSGALMTASHARERGCRVFAVPGEADDSMTAGCNDLIRHGALPVTDFRDILNAFRPPGGYFSPPAPIN